MGALKRLITGKFYSNGAPQDRRKKRDPKYKGPERRGRAVREAKQGLKAEVERFSQTVDGAMNSVAKTVKGDKGE